MKIRMKKTVNVHDKVLLAWARGELEIVAENFVVGAVPTSLDPLDVRRGNIWEYEQNKPSLIADDMERFGVEHDVTMKVLLARGVFKWLGIRRDLIKLKNIWRDEITATIEKIREAKKSSNHVELAALRGRLKTLEACRKQVRTLCHSERWQAPDFDKRANEFLKKLDDEERKN